MKYRLLLVAALAFCCTACQTTSVPMPKAKLAVEAPPGDLKDVSCKLEVTLN